MHASQTRPRRHERHDEDEHFVAARGSDRRSESYSRSHHHSSRAEPYGSSSVAHRGYTDSPHNRRSDDWRVTESAYVPSAHDRYRDDAVTHTRRDDYLDRSESWNGRASGHSQYSSVQREWTKRDDHGYGSTSYSESRAWGRTSRYEEPSRSTNGHDEWVRDDVRPERERDRYNRDEAFTSRDRSFRTRDEVVAIEPSRDRWAEQPDDRQRWRGGDRERGRERERDIAQEQDPIVDDVERKWEPAPSWKSRERDETFPARYERPESQHAFARPNKKPGKNKKKGHQAFQMRDTRRDDTMNNWQKRDFSSTQKDKDTARPSYGKRRHDHSPESRSRSPARSIYSRRSSNRSRSRSLSPKRRKRPEEQPARVGASPVGRKASSRRSRSPAYSQSSFTKLKRLDESRTRARQESISSQSSPTHSGSRSSSVTPDTKPKPKHRLPTTTSLRDIEIQAKTLRVSSNTTRTIGEPRNVPSGQAGLKAEEHPVVSAGSGSRETDRTRTQRAEQETMPPPAHPASASANGIPLSVHASTVVVEAQPRGTKRNAGFRPIGAATSAAMKQFFPDEDDESDSNVPPVDNRPSNRDVSQPVRHEENGADVRQRREVDMPSPRRVDREPETHRKRERSAQPPAWSDDFRDDAEEPNRRWGEKNSRVPISRQPTVKAGAYHDEPPTHTPRNERAPSVGAEAFPNGRIAREDSRPPTELPSRAGSALPSPATRQPEDIQSTEQMREGPRDQVYAIVSQVGEGTFGKVYKARNNITGVHVALKRIRMETERDGFPVTAMREIKLLQSLRHVNIVQLVEMMVHHGSVYMVFEYMDHDLTGVLSQTQFSFTDAHLKSLCQQMLQGLSYLHRKGVIHRDIKGSNILLNNRGELKLADFGLARFYQKRRRADYTNRVITLWYRPPELLLGTTVYGPEVDMWSAGCIMLELFCKKPVFQGNDEIHQLDVIYKILGTPTPEDWPSVADMPWYELVKPKDALRNRFRELFNKWLSPAGLDLAERLLSYDPTQRASADQALEAAYFSQEEPPSVLPVGLASLEGEWHEFESKRERAKKRRRVEAVASGGPPDPSSLPPQ